MKCLFLGYKAGIKFPVFLFIYQILQLPSFTNQWTSLFAFVILIFI